MKHNLLFAFLLLALSCSNALAQSDTASGKDMDETDTEGLYKEYPVTNNRLDTPVFNIGLYACSMPFHKQQAFGAGLSLKMNYRTDRAIGLHLDVLGRGINEDYGYVVGEPKLIHWNVGLFYEYTFFMKQNFQAGVRMYAGVSGFNLKDNSLKEIYVWYDEWGNAYEGERAVTVDENIFMRIAPAIDLSYKLSRSVALEGMASYDFYIGNPGFGKVQQFNNYMIGLGLQIRINDRN